MISMWLDYRYSAKMLRKVFGPNMLAINAFLSIYMRNGLTPSYWASIRGCRKAGLPYMTCMELMVSVLRDLNLLSDVEQGILNVGMLPTTLGE
jgi:hypothetical protein